jgi:DNA replication and repair protein RecF
MPMVLDRITLGHFRNHEATRLEQASQFNLLVGENGAGKTNVLEAISLLAPGRGLRRAALADIPVRGGPGSFSVSARLHTADDAEPVTLATGMQAQRAGRRLVKVNGADAPAMALGEWLSVSWLTPAMDRLFTDAASDRRRFMDRLALGIDPAHARYSSLYEKALGERNRLLSGDAEPDPAWLDAVEIQLADAGSALASSRARLVAALDAELQALPQEPFARPSLTYLGGGPLDRDELAAALLRSRPRDRAAQRTLVGPHRDELEVTLARKAMPAAACSTGEQKAMLIAIILAHAGLAAHGRPGVLLLDEVAAHLDPVRRAALFERLRSGAAQVWMTGTEVAPFEDILGEAAVWRVAGGTAERLD